MEQIQHCSVCNKPYPISNGPMCIHTHDWWAAQQAEPFQGVRGYLPAQPAHKGKSRAVEPGRLVLKARIATLEALLERCANFLENYSDVIDGSYGEPSPNAAMQLISAIREVVPESPALERPTAPGMGGGL